MDHVHNRGPWVHKQSPFTHSCTHRQMGAPPPAFHYLLSLHACRLSWLALPHRSAAAACWYGLAVDILLTGQATKAATAAGPAAGVPHALCTHSAGDCMGPLSVNRPGRRPVALAIYTASGPISTPSLHSDIHTGRQVVAPRLPVLAVFAYMSGGHGKRIRTGRQLLPAGLGQVLCVTQTAFRPWRPSWQKHHQGSQHVGTITITLPVPAWVIPLPRQVACSHTPYRPGASIQTRCTHTAANSQVQPVPAYGWRGLHLAGRLMSSLCTTVVAAQSTGDQ